MKELFIGLLAVGLFLAAVILMFKYPAVMFLAALVGLAYFIGCSITGKAEEW